MHVLVNVIFVIPRKKLWERPRKPRASLPNEQKPLWAEPGGGCRAMHTLSWDQPEGEEHIKINPNRSQY